MGKVIKIILSVISGVILTLIIIPVLLYLTFNVSMVQDYAGRLLTSYLSRKLETTVTVDNVRFRLFNRVTVEGIYVEDYGGDTLLYAERLNVPVHSVNRHGIRLGNVVLEAPALNLVEDTATGTTGMRKLVDRVRGDTAKVRKTFRISAAGVEVSRMKFMSRKLEGKDRQGGIDFSDLAFSDIYVKVRDLEVVDDSICAAVERVTCREKSGFVLDDFSAAEASVTDKVILVRDIIAVTPDSEVRMNHVSLTSMELRWYRKFLDDVSFAADVVDSKVAFGTLAYFAPELRGWSTVMENVSLRVDGPLAAMEGDIRQLHSGNTDLSADFRVEGLPDVSRTRFHLGFRELHTDVGDLSGILGDIGVAVPRNALSVAERLGGIDYAGTLDGLLSDFTATGRLTTGQGAADVNLNYRNRSKGDVSLSGSLSTDHFEPGALIGAGALGPVSLSAEVEAQISPELRINSTASVGSIMIRDYTYRDIRLDSSFSGKDFSGEVHSADENMAFDFNGMFSFVDSIPEYNFDLALHRADLHRIGLNDRDSVSVIRGNLRANGSGATLDDMNGRAVITGATYLNQSDTVSFDRVDLHADNDPSQKSIGMYSSMADVELRGVSSYRYMFSFLRNALASYLPSITEREIPYEHEFGDMGEIHDINNFYILDADFKENSRIAGIFLPGLEISAGTKLSFMFNPRWDYFSLTANSDYIRRGDRLQITGLSINSRNEADSVSLFVNAEEVLLRNVYLPDLSIVGGAKDNRITLATRFSNPDTGISALINTESTLTQDTVTGAARMHVGFAPSYIVSEGQRWVVTARDIAVEPGRVAFDGFRLFSGGQQFRMDGTASASRGDTVRVVLDNFDLAALLAITSRQSYFISGISNGRAEVASLLRSPAMYADIELDSVKINDAGMPDSRFESYWDAELEQAGFMLFEQGSDDLIVNGYYSPSQRRLRADFRFDSLNLSLIDPLLPGVLRNSRGTASARVTLASTASRPVIDGNIHINDLSTVVDYTNVPYSIRDSEVAIRNSVMRLEETRLWDGAGNSGAVRATLDLSNMRNPSFDVTVLPQSLQVLGTTIAENELFYGDIYASDSVNIHGSGNRVRIDVSATTAGQSRFFMNLGYGKDISRADFIVFESPAEAATAGEDAPRRLRTAERRAGSSRTGSQLGIGLNLDVRPNTEVYLVLDPASGDAVRGRGNGDLDIRIDPEDRDNISIYGSYEITEGNYLFNVWNFVSRNFMIEPGSSVHWTGDPMEGQLDIRAVHRVKASLAPLLGSDNLNSSRTTNVDCIINITGSISAPEIAFDVVVPNATPEVQTSVAHAMNTEEMEQNQFIWLLAFKSFAAEGSYDGGSTFGTVTGIDFVANQIGAILSSDRFSFMPSVRVADKLYSSEYGGSFYGELIKDRLYLDVDVMYDSGDNPASINYRTANNFTGDATLSLLLDESGNFRFQAFSRTIDRFDEYQGLQESGIGIFYRENFDNLADLREILRQRFTRKKKRNQPEAGK